MPLETVPSPIFGPNCLILLWSTILHKNQVAQSLKTNTFPQWAEGP